MHIKIVLSFLIVLLINTTGTQAQNYPNIASYFNNGTPTHGVKIKTNIPFAYSADMVTLTLKGYAYGQIASMNIQLSFYIYYNDSGTYFHNPVVSSAAAYAPNILVANEAGKVVLFIDDRVYYHRFYVDAFSGYIKPDFYNNWSIVDEPLNGSAVAAFQYKNAFRGDVTFAGGRWTSEGNVGIGTESPKERLSVNGKIRAHEVKVETADWPDYVFEKDYDLLTVPELEEFIAEHGHLPEIPKASAIEADGLSLGEMNKLLLKKIEELTLYVIQQGKEIEQLKAASKY